MPLFSRTRPSRPIPVLPPAPDAAGAPAGSSDPGAAASAAPAGPAGPGTTPERSATAPDAVAPVAADPSPATAVPQPAPAAQPPAPPQPDPADPAAGRIVAPARAPRLPDGWAYRFTSPAMGTARIDVLDHRGRAVAGETFVGHAGSPEFVIAAACGRAHAAWQETGGVVFQVQPFTASSSPEGAGWRVWCNQALGVSFVVDDLEQAPALMAQALAEAKGLHPEDVSVTMVASR